MPATLMFDEETSDECRLSAEHYYFTSHCIIILHKIN